jgi:hypothetical protein
MPGKHLHTLSFRHVPAELKRIRRDSVAPFEKSDKSMEIEQRHVIKFFIDEGMKSLDILMRLHKH